MASGARKFARPGAHAPVRDKRHPHHASSGKEEMSRYNCLQHESVVAAVAARRAICKC